MNDDDALFDWDDEEEENQSTAPSKGAEAWNILIVDDEPEIHKITELALANVTFKDRELKFHSAFSGAEALEYMRDNEDTAVVLLDVVMEHDHAGLETAQKIRHELHNRSTRIILRTGQPGQAPEREVITQYDINDYKAKTELTASKLFTTIIASLRSYHDILCLEANRHGLEKIVRASASVFALQSFQDFFGGLLTQMNSIFSLHGEAHLIQQVGERTTVLCSATDSDSNAQESETLLEKSGVSSELQELILKTFTSGESQFGDHACTCLIPNADPSLVLAYTTETEGMDQDFVKLFAQNIGAAIRNMKLHDNLKEFNQSLERFLPKEALNFLNKSNVTELKLGDYIEGDFCSFFLDIRRFTALAETMEPREALNFINSFLSELAPIVSAHHGVIDKYLGDGFMAVFGRNETARSDSLKCAVQILLTLSAYNETHRSQQVDLKRAGKARQAIEIGIGIQSGPMIMGAVGHQGRIDFTVIGDVVNSASRIQHLNKFFGTNILIHDNMVGSIPDGFKYRYIGAVAVKGKREPLKLWELFEADSPEQRALKVETKATFEQAMDFIDANDLVPAHPLLVEVLHKNPDDTVAQYHMNAIIKSNQLPHLRDQRNIGPN